MLCLELQERFSKTFQDIFMRWQLKTLPITALSSVLNESNKVPDLFRSNIVVSGYVGQPKKENNFSKQRAIEIYF